MADNQPNLPPTISGRVLIAGVGMIVSGAMWALIGFVRYQQGATEVAMLDAALALAHFFVGIAVLLRIRASWPIGLVVAVAGVLATIPNDYYLPLIADGVTGVLLFLSREDLMAPRAPKAQ